MSLPLPTWYPRPPAGQSPSAELRPTHLPSGLSGADLARETDTCYFTALGHWELSHVVTTNHLLSVIAITNTLVSVSNATFVPEQERKRKLVRQATHGAMEVAMNSDSSFGHVQEQIKQGWSLLRDHTQMTSANLFINLTRFYCIHNFTYIVAKLAKLPYLVKTVDVK